MDQGFVLGEQRDENGEVVAECHAGETPGGGTYSIARYMNDAGSTGKRSATTVELTVYDDEGNVLETTYGTLDGS